MQAQSQHVSKPEQLPQKPRPEDDVDRPEASWDQRVIHLTQQIANDCSLRKGVKTKFIKHAQQAGKIFNGLPAQPSCGQLLLMAGLYKNLGKLGQHEQFLQRGLEFLKKAKGTCCLSIRWTLQLIAFKSSAKKREECYGLASKTLALAQQLLGEMLQKQNLLKEERMLGQLVLELSHEQTKDEVVWLYNDRNMADEMLARLRKSSPQSLALPFYHQFQFHIADIMTLQSCREGWQSKHSDNLRDLIIYLSICCFTLATEKYYLKDYTQKCSHIKALKMALAAFDLNCTYVAFLIKILQEHFGKNMHPITQEPHLRGEIHELMYYLPKETKEVSTLELNFADQ